MTEHQAKKKICPLTFGAAIQMQCQGSVCILWRQIKWDGVPAHHADYQGQGYCGLGGNPAELR